MSRNESNGNIVWFSRKRRSCLVVKRVAQDGVPAVGWRASEAPGNVLQSFKLCEARAGSEGADYVREVKHRQRQGGSRGKINRNQVVEMAKSQVQRALDVEGPTLGESEVKHSEVNHG